MFSHKILCIIIIMYMYIEFKMFVYVRTCRCSLIFVFHMLFVEIYSNIGNVPNTVQRNVILHILYVETMTILCNSLYVLCATGCPRYSGFRAGICA